MTEFHGERIDVETDKKSPRPVSFRWEGQAYTVVEILKEWVDTGFGDAPPASRKWFNRRHRRYYIVRVSDGDAYEIYFDYANRKNKTWWLVSKVE